mmetsp:Transcript_10396/g.29174  ORF Transcript_10396/g.29174 Transcript_10396/m.29174 type:complete len:387 (-) Transcript_10396:83-1243(-)
MEEVLDLHELHAVKVMEPLPKTQALGHRFRHGLAQGSAVLQHVEKYIQPRAARVGIIARAVQPQDLDEIDTVGRILLAVRQQPQATETPLLQGRGAPLPLGKGRACHPDAALVVLADAVHGVEQTLKVAVRPVPLRRQVSQDPVYQVRAPVRPLVRRGVQRERRLQQHGQGTHDHLSCGPLVLARALQGRKQNRHTPLLHKVRTHQSGILRKGYADRRQRDVRYRSGARREGRLQLLHKNTTRHLLWPLRRRRARLPFTGVLPAGAPRWIAGQGSARTPRTVAGRKQALAGPRARLLVRLRHCRAQLRNPTQHPPRIEGRQILLWGRVQSPRRGVGLGSPVDVCAPAHGGLRTDPRRSCRRRLRLPGAPPGPVKLRPGGLHGHCQG